MRVILEYSGQRYILYFKSKHTFDMALKYLWFICDSCVQAYKPRRK